MKITIQQPNEHDIEIGNEYLNDAISINQGGDYVALDYEAVTDLISALNKLLMDKLLNS